MSLLAILEAVLIGTGAGLLLLAGIGLVRMPDLFMRMQAGAKASSLGLGLLMTGTAVHFHALAVIGRATGIVVFVFLTVPIAGHLVARSAYHVGIPLWPKTRVDEFRQALDEDEE